MPPPTQAANGGVLPAAILKKDGASAKGSSRGRQPAPRTKVVVRRLPPGLTEVEFEKALGEEWKVGAGKVNWFDFRPGKVSKDLSKPSRPARAYLNVSEESFLPTLKETVLQCAFTDAKNTTRDAALVGPPTLEYAPYTRVPLGKRRADARQGTIDQDAEFIDFLQSLTNPVAKPASLDADGGAEKEKITTTPLIEHLREKKAAKEKNSKAGKAKQEPAKEVKSDKTPKKTAKPAPEVADKPKKLSKAEKAAQQAVKVLNKEAAAVVEKAKETTASPASAAPERKPERPARQISVAARIQQDLGLSPAQRRAKRDAAAAERQAAAATTNTIGDGASAATSNASTTTVAAAASPRRDPRASRVRRSSRSGDKPALDAPADSTKPIPTGPSQPTLLKKNLNLPPKGPTTTSTSTQQPVPPKGPKAQTVTTQQPGTPNQPPVPVDPASLPRHAFLKHANPSQGITEALIEEALKVYGGVEKVEIDRKKGFAYVDFADNETMKKAIAASPIKVAQGAVQVLEKRDKSQTRAIPSGPMGRGGGTFRGGRGGRSSRGGGAVGGARGGTAPGSPAPVKATPAVPVPVAAPTQPAAAAAAAATAPAPAPS